MRNRMGSKIVTAVLAGAATFAAGDARAGQPGTVDIEPNDESAWDIPGEHVVDFRDDVGLPTLRSFLEGLGLLVVPTDLADATGIAVVSLPAAGAAALIDRLRADPRVEHVEPHARVRVAFVPDDPLYAEQWHLARVGAERAWSYGVGRGVTVAVIDTGIACESHGEFAKATDLAETRCVEGYNFVDDHPHANDDHGHGTHVAGTIAQSTDNALGAAGLAFGARLMPVKVLSADGFGTTTAVADGIRWAADNGAQVLNLSLGGPRNARVLQDAVDYARERGVVIVAAAGNTGGPVGYPGGSNGVIGVGASDPDDALAYFSARGSGVDLAAPGVRVVQQTVCERGRNQCEIFPGYNGTSMASPHVAAAAALLVGHGVSSPDAVERALRRSARPGRDGEAMGAGVLATDDALRGAALAQWAARMAALGGLALLAFQRARRKGAVVAPTSLAFWIVAIAAAVGLFFFAPLVVSRQAWYVDWLARPIGEWDLLLSAQLHRYLPFANVLLPLGAAAVFLGTKRGAAPIAGLAIGTGAYLASVAVLGTHASPFGWALTTAWCALNALGCWYLGALVMQRR